jgi:Tfp pilus assembly protein PilO
MKVSSSTRTILAVLIIAAVAFAFWTLLLSPKREEVASLAEEREGLQTALSQAQSEVAAGEAARREFATNYEQLVVLGKAVPADDESASLLVQLDGVANRSKVSFQSLLVGTASESEPPPEEAEPEPSEPAEPAVGEEGTAPEGEATATAVPATEAAAAMAPLGSTVGPAGLSVMPFNLNFKGDFFKVAKFIDGVDSLIQTKSSKLAVDGRLITLDGFSLVPDEDGFPLLNANFAVTTYLVPPGEGIVGGATPTAPEGAAVGLASSTTEGLE